MFLSKDEAVTIDRMIHPETSVKKKTLVIVIQIQSTSSHEGCKRTLILDIDFFKNFNLQLVTPRLF